MNNLYEKTNRHRVFNSIILLLFVVAVISITIAYVFNVGFVEKYIDKDQRIGVHVQPRVTLFQKQMFSIALFFGSICLLLSIFKKKVLRFFYDHKRFLTNLLFFFIFLIILFLIGEMVLRLFFSEIILNEYGSGPGNSYKNKLNYNSLGYRDIEHKFEKDKDVYRILFLGDSMTFGSGIKKFEDIYAIKTQDKLNEIYYPNKFESVIMATSGYSTLDELKALKKTGLKFNPDLIVIGYFLNDAEGGGSRNGYENAFYSHFIIPYELGEILYRHSYLYYLFESRIRYVLTGLGFYKTNIDYTKHLYSDSNPYFQQHKKDLEELIGIANENEIRLLIVMIPSLQTDLDDYPYKDIHAEIRNISESNHSCFLDLLPYFKGYELKKVRLSFLDAHMNELGHKIASDAIIAYLQEKQLL